MEFFKKIPNSHTWKEIRKLESGWSYDQKYQIITNKTKMLLKILDVSKYEYRKVFFADLKKLKELNINTAHLIDYGIIENHFYMLYTWLEGIDLKDGIYKFSEDEQYQFAYNLGKVLNKIHQTKAPDSWSDWSFRINKKIDTCYKLARDYQDRIMNFDKIYDFIDQNRSIIINRPQSFQHGDFHIGNMVIDENKNIGIIDFDRCDYGDPYEDLKSIYWNIHYGSCFFASGLIDGYFEKQIPDEFFKLLAFYQALSLLAWIPWAANHGQEELDITLAGVKETLVWYDNFNKVIPNWYKR